MKKISILAFIVLLSSQIHAQLNPVSWSFSARKTGDKTAEIEMRATIQEDWHLYSQTQPEDAIAMPTTFIINRNPLVTLDGKITETGKLEKFTDKKLGLSANQYSNSVVFIQKIKLRSRAKTNLTGTVEYQTCDDKKCLPPKRINFSIPIQ